MEDFWCNKSFQMVNNKVSVPQEQEAKESATEKSNHLTVQKKNREKNLIIYIASMLFFSYQTLQLPSYQTPHELQC